MEVMYNLLDASLLDLTDSDTFDSVVRSIVEWYSGKAATREMKANFKKIILYLKANGFESQLNN